MKWIRSTTFHWLMGGLGIGGSVYCLIRFGQWRHLSWPGTPFLLLSVSLVLLEMACRAERLKRVTPLVGTPISFWESVWVNALGDIYGAATPSSFGGEVSRLASLTRLGLTGSGAMVTLAIERFALLLSLATVMILSVLILLVKNPALLSVRSLLLTFLLYVGFSIGLVIFMIVAIRLKKIEARWHELTLRPDILGLAMVHHGIRLSFLPLSLWFLAGADFSPMIFIWSFILSYGVALLPIPSGGGSMELTFLALFKPMFGGIRAAATLVWWRLLSHYLYVFISLLVAIAGMIHLAPRRGLLIPLAKKEEIA